MSEETDEKATAMTPEEYAQKMKDFLKIIKGSDNTTYVSQEVFRQTMDLFAENLRDLFSLIQEYAMDKRFELEYKFGDIHLAVRSDSKDLEKSVTAMMLMFKELSKKIFDKKRLETIVRLSKGNDINEKNQSIYG